MAGAAPEMVLFPIVWRFQEIAQEADVRIVREGCWVDLGAQRTPDLWGGYSYRSALAGFALATAKDCQKTVTHAISTAATAASTKVQALNGAW